MAIDPQILKSLGDPTGGRLTDIGQIYAKSQQRGIENERQAESDSMKSDLFKLEMEDTGSKVMGAYANDMLDWKKANPDKTDEEFSAYQLEAWGQLSPMHQSFVPKGTQTLPELEQGKINSENMQRALHPELYKEKDKKSSFEIVKLEREGVEGEMEEMSFHKDDKERVRKHLDDGWNLVSSKGVTTNVNLPGDTAYSKERLKVEATRIGELTDEAESSYNAIKSLKRFKEASKEGYQGSLQPIMTGVRNVVASFGYDSEKLSDVRYMEQALGELQKQTLELLGARGLTDKDMEILQRALPRVETDKVARDAIADILIKSNTYKISQWEHGMKEEKRIWPQLADQIRQPYWHSLYREEIDNKDVFGRADAILRDSKQ